METVHTKTLTQNLLYAYVRTELLIRICCEDSQIFPVQYQPPQTKMNFSKN